MIAWLRRFRHDWLNGFHAQSCDLPRMRCFRVFGLRRAFRLCWFDWTFARLYAGRPAYVRLRLLRWTIFERNRQFSGLPDA